MSDSNNNTNNNHDGGHTGPGYFNGLPLNPKMNMMDDDVEEVTRKIAPTMIMPSLGPLPTMPPSAMMGQGGGSATINTSPMKAPSLERYGLVQQKQKQVTTRFVWNLTSAPSLPEFHPLERTAVFIPHSTPSDIAPRISSILRERSIEAQYDDSKAKVRCTTEEGVDFRIRLYRGRGRYNHGIIVEVQRRFGTSLVFHNDTQAILDGAEGKVSTLTSPPSFKRAATTTTTLAPPSITSKNLPEVTDEDEDTDTDDEYGSGSSSADSSLAMVAKMMKLPGFDSQYLGLQTLSPLVDSDRLSLSTARAVATKLFQPDNEVGIKVFQCIVNNNNSNNRGGCKGKKRKSRGVFDDEDDDDDDDDNNDSMILRNMCLNILANSLRAYDGTKQEIPLFLRELLRPALLQDLQDADKHPNTALLSAKSLQYFVKVDHDTTELYDAFDHAKQVGESKHSNLMIQAQKCMSAIQ
jgi:hypothetical protein